MKNFIVNKLGVSTMNYTTKPNFKNVRYNVKENLSIDEWVQLIRSGYSFTHSFDVSAEYGNKEKTLANFKQTNFIWFDFDDCADSINKVYKKLTYKPNIAYTTISNLQKGKSHRFRLVYLIDFTIQSNDSYKYYLNLLLNTIINDLTKDYLKYIDNNCFNTSQQMFGSNINSTIITSDNTYNSNSFNEINANFKIYDYLNKNRCGRKLNNNILKKEKKILKQNDDITTSLSELIEMLQSFDVKLFSPTLTNEHLAIFDNDTIYTNVIDQNIYKINFLYDINNKIRKVNRGHRNNMLFNWGITIRNINPEIKIDELTKNLYWLYINHCTRSDDFNMMQVCTLAMSVLKADLDEYFFLGKRKYLIDPEQKHISRADKSKALGVARRRTRDLNILENYDFGKTVKENAKDLSISENTIRNCFNDNEIKLPNQEKFERFVEVYTSNPNASIRRLAELTKLSTKTVQGYIKKLKSI